MLIIMILIYYMVGLFMQTSRSEISVVVDQKSNRSNIAKNNFKALCLGLATMLLISSCNEGSSASTTIPKSNIVAINKVKFNTVILDSQAINYNDNAATTYFTNIAGYYINANKTQSSYQKANAINTKALYNLDPLNTINLASSVSAYDVLYKTPATNIGAAVASGLIIVPNNIKIKGVVLYFHPTTWGKNQVPSCLGDPLKANNYVAANNPTYCSLAALDANGANTFMMLSHVFASRGYAVIAPDYLGQGNDYNNVHPYVAFPEINAISAFNMFPALRSILNDYNKIDATKELPLFITGYSEGGAYAIEAAKLITGSSKYTMQARTANLKLEMTAPQEGAYSLADQVNFDLTDLNDGFTNCSKDSQYQCGQVDMMNGMNLSSAVQNMNKWNIGSSIYSGKIKPLLLSYILTAINFYKFDNTDASYDFTMYRDFWKNISLKDGRKVSLYDLYSGKIGSTLTGEDVETAIEGNAFTVNGYDPFISPNIKLFLSGIPIAKQLPEEPWGQNTAASVFVHEYALKTQSFQAIMQNASTYDWHATSPIHFINMQYDSAVSTMNYLQAYTCMKHGISYVGNLVSSTAECNSSSASTDMIASTVIPNFPLTNNIEQLAPLDLSGNVSVKANSKFWTNNIISDQSLDLYTPFDHGDMFVLGSIIALCTFENAYNNGLNSGYCPN